MKEEDNNVCCPHLYVMDCGDTKAHKHFFCRQKGEIITNKIVQEKCMKLTEDC